MATTKTEAPDLTKVVLNPKSVTFEPVAKRQMVTVEMINNCTSDVAVKFKTSFPVYFKANPPQARLGAGEKKTFNCVFKGAPRDKCRLNDRFTVIIVHASKNARIEKIWANAHKNPILKHKIAILYEGINDHEKNEAPQPIPDTQKPMNKDEDVNKDQDQQAVKDEQSKIVQK